LRPDRHVRQQAHAAAIWCAALAATLFSVAGCGYRVAGRANSLPPTVQTIAVTAFVNKTSNYRIEQRLTEAVARELLARTKYRVVSKPEDADAVLSGEVTTVGSSALVFDPVTGAATTVLVTVNMKASLQDRASGNVLYKNDNFVFREPYEVSTDITPFFQQEGPALDRMSRDFAARLVADILEKF
jgi:outer membrane lipopolysaccharide assembly protein LptE/RlpB